MSELARLLAQLRQTAGLTQQQLAERLGVKPAVISMREHGRTDLPARQLEQFAAACGAALLLTAEGWFLVQPPPAVPPNPERDQPLRLGPDIAVGGSGAAGGGVLGPQVVREFWNAGERWFRELDALVRIDGHSLEPTLRHGDWVGVRLGAPYRPGDIVVAELGDRREVVVKVYAGEVSGFLVLNSINPAHAPVIAKLGEAEIVGPAWGAWRPGRLTA